MFETSDLNTIKTLLANKPESVRLLEVDDNSFSKRIKDIKKIALEKKLKIEIKKFKNPNKKINLIFKPSEPKNIEYLEKFLETKEDAVILLLDHITDPNNLGSILRTSLGGMVDAVVVPKSRACHLTASVREVSKGSSELIPFVIVPNLKRITEMLKLRGFLIYGAEGNSQSESIYDTDFSKKLGLIIGSENRGIQETLKLKCDKIIKIPISDKLESLNAAIATSVIVFEINRQRTN